MKKSIITSSLIIIGNEVLSGRTKDINTSTLALWLNTIGIIVKEVRIIPDDELTIIETVNEYRKKFNYVFTTGGIGPTHDDITASSISKAFELNYDFHKEAFSILEKYYKPGEFTEGRQKMAKMPTKANLILNPTSGAPGFYVENVFCLPGVPSILQSMLGGLNNVLAGGEPIISRTLNLLTVESEIAKSLSIVQNQNNDVEIGSYPFFKAGKIGVSIVMRSTSEKKIDECSKQIINFLSEKKIKILKDI
jgi:molybdenum cofactor synthesis domain-containing protein